MSFLPDREFYRCVAGYQGNAGSRDWRVFTDLADVSINIARPLDAASPIGLDLEQSLHALDSTSINLCLALFPWARFRKRKATVKMHRLLDLHDTIPTFIRIPAARCTTSTSSTSFL